MISLAQLNIGLHSDLRKTQDRTGWRRPRPDLEFANDDDDDDDIYDSEHRLKLLAIHFGTTIIIIDNFNVSQI